MTTKFAGKVTLYAVWQEYSNPFIFDYDNTKIVGLSEQGLALENADIILPRHKLYLVGSNVLVGEDISGVSALECNGQVKSIDFKFVTDEFEIESFAFENAMLLSGLYNIKHVKMMDRIMSSK